MGWPPCLSSDCKNWPSVGFTGLCKVCINDPKKVEEVAHNMSVNYAMHTRLESSDHYLVCWLSREPEKCLNMTLRIIQGGETDVRKALEIARRYYWKTINAGGDIE